MLSDFELQHQKAENPHNDKEPKHDQEVPVHLGLFANVQGLQDLPAGPEHAGGVGRAAQLAAVHAVGNEHHTLEAVADVGAVGDPLQVGRDGVKGDKVP